MPDLFTRELANYLDEPAQMPSGVVGKNARLHLGFARRGERTALVALERQVPLLAQQALYCDRALPTMPCVYIITTSGCILQGDRFHLFVHLAPDSQAHVTTQAATKVHAMDANYAAQVQELVLEDNAYLEYIPDPIIPHRHARFVSATQITLAPTATLLYSEILMPGRKYHREGELFEYDLFASNVHVARPDGTELAAECFVVEPDRYDPRRLGILSRYDVFGNVYLLTPPPFAEAILKQVPAVVNVKENWAAGAGVLPNGAGLVYKVLGMESEVVSAQVRAFWGIARQTIRGAGLSPKVFA